MSFKEKIKFKLLVLYKITNFDFKKFLKQYFHFLKIKKLSKIRLKKKIVLKCVLLFFIIFVIFYKNFCSFRRCGYIGFFVISFIFIVDFFLLLIIEFFNPKEKIDLAPDVSEFGRKIKQTNN